MLSPGRAKNIQANHSLITFKITQLIYSRHVNARDERTDERTDEQLTWQYSTLHFTSVASPKECKRSPMHCIA